jgi:hypothetical protein
MYRGGHYDASDLNNMNSAYRAPYSRFGTEAVLGIRLARTVK